MNNAWSGLLGALDANYLSNMAALLSQREDQFYHDVASPISAEHDKKSYEQHHVGVEVEVQTASKPARCRFVS